MNHDNFTSAKMSPCDDAPPSHDTPSPGDEHRDEITTSDDTEETAATVPRHEYAMTIQDVGHRLNRLSLDRDIRTIQRWCKSGKLKAIIDDTNGERWLILPSSVDELVATLLQERERQQRDMSHSTNPSWRQKSGTVDDASPTPRPSVTQAERTAQPRARHEDDKDTTSHESAATSRPADEDVAAMTRRVTELEKENMLLQIDLKAREKMVDYQQDWFDKTYQDMRDDLQRLGSIEHEVHALREDNDRLRSLLPAPAKGQSSPFKPRT